MKTFKFLIILTISGLNVLAQAQSPDSNDGVTQAINAEVQTTHDRVQNLLLQMSKSENPYEDADYSKIAQQFKSRIPIALQTYENQMKSIILPKAQYWLNRYVTTLKIADKNEKFLRDASSAIAFQFYLLSIERQNLITELYTSILGDFPSHLILETVQRSGIECKVYDNSKSSMKQAAKYQYASFNVIAIGLKGTRSAPQFSQVCEIGTEFRTADDRTFYSPNALTDIYIATARYAAEQREINEDAVTFLKAPLRDFLVQGCATATCRQLRLADAYQFIVLVSQLIDQDIALPYDFRISGKMSDMAQTIQALVEIQK